MSPVAGDWLDDGEIDEGMASVAAESATEEEVKEPGFSEEMRVTQVDGHSVMVTVSGVHSSSVIDAAATDPRGDDPDPESATSVSDAAAVVTVVLGVVNTAPVLVAAAVVFPSP